MPSRKAQADVAHLPCLRRELLRNMHYNPIRSVVAVACAIIFATLFANQGQKTETSGGERAGCPAPPRPAGIAEHVGRPELMSMAVGMPARPGWVRQELRLRPYPLAGWIALQQASSTSRVPCTPHPSLSVRRRSRKEELARPGWMRGRVCSIIAHTSLAARHLLRRRRLLLTAGAHKHHLHEGPSCACAALQALSTA